MNKKLVLIDESTEELLASIDELDEEAAEQTLDSQDNKTYLFLQRFKLRAGKNKIDRKYLYTLYSKSTFEPISQQKFYAELLSLIPYEKSIVSINKNLDGLLKDIKPEYKNKGIISHYLMRRFEKFIDQNNIADGKDVYVSEKALYFFVDKWSYNKKIKSFRFMQFKKLLSLYLHNKKRLTNEISYGLDKKFYDKISTEEISKAKEWAKKYKPSRKNEIPSS